MATVADQLVHNLLRERRHARLTQEELAFLAALHRTEICLSPGVRKEGQFT